MAQMKYKAILENLQNIEDPALKAQLAANFLHEMIGCPDKMMQFLESGHVVYELSDGLGARNQSKNGV